MKRKLDMTPAETDALIALLAADRRSTPPSEMDRLLDAAEAAMQTARERTAYMDRMHEVPTE